MQDFLRTVFNRLIRAYRDNPLTQAAGREYLYSDNKKCFEPLTPEDTREHAPPVIVADVASLIDWCKHIERDHDEELTNGQVLVSRRGNTQALTPVFAPKHVKRELAEKTFYMGFMPGEKFTTLFGYVEFLSWIELLGERIEGVERLELSLKTVSAIDGGSVTVESDGAVIRIRGETDSGPKVNGVLPKRIKTCIPFGDPSCVLPVEFGLQCMVAPDRSVKFGLRHLESDGAFDAYASWMRSSLGSLPEPWLVLVGP